MIEMNDMINMVSVTDVSTWFPYTTYADCRKQLPYKKFGQVELCMSVP